MDGDQSFPRWTLTSQSVCICVCLSVCVCVCVTMAHLCGPLRASLSLPSYSDPHPQRSTLRALRPWGVCLSFWVCVCVYECQYMQGWVLGGQTYTHTQSFSWSHQWIVNTVLTMAGRPLATTYWIRYVTSDMASIWNPFVMQYSGVLHVKVRTQSWVIERS